jgi:uncharacterized protein with NRDE domain
MCTFILFHKLVEDFPVIALHNRYLGLNTREEPPQSMGHGVYCPLDEESQGTWIGFNRDGLFMAITNQETHTVNKLGRSRGLLALDVLREYGSSAEAKEYLMDTSIRHLYRPGNFVVADSENAWHILWDYSTMVWKIEPGPYAMGVVTMYPGVQLSERAERVSLESERRRKRAQSLLDGFKPSSIDEAILKMKQVSADHEYGKTTASICWHSTEFRQTSSTIIAVASKSTDSKVLYCVGNACESPFNEYRVSFD